jgi:hypothetical protein
MTMTIMFKPAVRSDVKLMIGLGGPSGSGKTYSALRIATGLAPSGKIYMIDTESRRGLHYADQFAYHHADLEAPFSSDRYLEAIESAVKAGAEVVIVDSMSHEHEGVGGILEQHEAELERMAGNDWAKRERVKFAAWIKPKRSHNKFVNRVLQLPCHFIFCFRAKDKLQLNRVGGKTEVVSAGLQPICSDRFEYEMTAMLVLPAGARGVPDPDAPAVKIQEQHRALFPAKLQLDENLGKALAEWSKGAETKPAAPAPAAPSNGTDFWSRESLEIPMKGTYPAWEKRILKAAKAAPTFEAVARLKEDNDVTIKAYLQHDEAAANRLVQALKDYERIKESEGASLV